jgi:hypothetical protein
MSDAIVMHEAKREPVFMSIMLAGPSGSGKTWSALALATGLAAGKSIVLIDTEVKPASLYADEYKFKRIALRKPFTPERYREALKLARASKPAVIIVDSATHEWIGNGGILPSLDSMPGSNNMLKWKDLTPRHDRWSESMTDSRASHIIVCCRGKERFAIDEVKDDQGNKKTKVTRVGMRPIQRKDFFYDFMVAFILNPDTHDARILNNTTKTFRDFTPRPLTAADGKALALWAASGKTKGAKA